MKGCCHQARPAAANGRGRRGRVNTSRAYAAEHQAERVSRRFTRGERHLSSLVTPAAPAGFRLPSSPGIPLGPSLRRDLETGFDARLDAVRLHADAAAGTAAHAFGALAFASGAHVFFAPGFFRPGTADGRALLAHEITHVLQQTGRRGSGTELVATSIAGAGTIQCAGAGSTPEEIAAQEDAFKGLAALHRGPSGSSSGTDLDAAISAAETLLGGRFWASHEKPAWAKRFATAVEGGKFDKGNARARSFVFDCAKGLGFFPEAARLVADDPEFLLRTVAAHQEFFDYLRLDSSFGRERLAPFLGHKAFAKLWPAAVLRGWREFFLHPRIIPGLDAELMRQLTANVAVIEKERGAAPPTLRTETYWAAWRLVGELDDQRIQQSGELRERLLQLSGRQSIYEVLVQQIPVLRAAEKKILTDPVAPEYQRVIAQGKLDILKDVEPIWQEALQSYRGWLTAFNALTAEQLILHGAAEGLPDAALVRDAMTPLRAPLVEATRALFEIALDADGRLVPVRADEYEVRLTAFRRALAQDAFALKKGGDQASLLGHVDDFLARQGMAATPDKARVAAFALLPLVFDGLLALSFAYDAKADQDAPAFADRREAHRVRMARFIAAIGRWLGWDDLIERVRPALLDEEDPAHIYDTPTASLFLVSDWEADEVRPIVDILTDFPGTRDKPILRDTPITGKQLVEWFRYRYHRSLRDTMLKILAWEDVLSAQSRPEFEELAHTKQTQSEVRQSMGKSAQAETDIPDASVSPFPLKVPQRFLVSDYELLVPPGATVNWNDLLHFHPKTKLQLIRRAEYLIYPNEASAGVFAWAIPSLDDLIAVMKKIPRIAKLADKYGPPETRWLKAFSPADNRLLMEERDKTEDDRAAEKITLTNEEFEEFKSALDFWLKRLGEHEVKELPALRRRTVILRRRWLMMRLIPEIAHFAKYPHVSHGPMGESDAAFARRLKTPETVVNAIYAFETFARNLELQTDDAGERARAEQAAEIQAALLIIGLSSSLLDVNIAFVDGYFKRHLYGFYQLAIDYASDAARIAQLKAGVGVNDEVASMVFSADRLEKMKTRMQEVMRAIEKELEESQERRGYGSDDGKSILPNAHLSKKPIVASRKPDPEHEWRIGQTLGADGQIDETSGVLYRLVDVYHKFEFHPHAGSKPVEGIRKGRGGPYSPAWIVIDGVRYDDPNLPDIELFKIHIGGNDIVVRANNLPLLEELDETFLWRSFSMALEELAGDLETFAQWMITVVSLFVPEVAMAEFVANLARMFASGEFDDLIHQLKNDPIEVIERVLDELKKNLFKPENMWRYLLLGGQHSPWHALTSVFPKRQQKVKATPRTKFGRLAAALRALGARFKYSLDRVRAYFQPPLRRAQGRIAMHPTLVWLLRRAAHVVQLAFDLIPFDELEQARKKEGPAHATEFTALLHADKESIDAAFRERLAELFEGIQHFDLPGELVNLDIATELIVSFLLDRFGPRGKIIRMLLQVMPVPDDWGTQAKRGGFTTAMQVLTGEIAAVWRNSPLDPNNIWRDAVIPEIGPRFTTVRDELVTGMYDLVDALLQEFGLDKLSRPTASELPVTEVEPEPVLPESEAAPGDRRPRGGSMRLSPVGGSPLASPVRQQLERALGADLSHVRVHPGASSATAAIGADALTSGSHIFFDPQVSITSARGKEVLAHESAHVVQQTGAFDSRNRGRRAPTLGRPAAGLKIDPDREAVANVIARHVTGGRQVSVSLRQRVGRAAGVQPAMGEQVVESVLDTLTTTKPSDFTKDLEGGRTPEGWTDAQKLAELVFGRLRKLQELQFASFLKDTSTGEDIPKLVQTYVRELTDKFPEMELKRIAELAQKPRRKKQKNDPDTGLDPKGFIQLLGNYIYANRHVALRISTDLAVTKIKDIEIFNLNIAEIGGTAKFWSLAMKRSFKTMTDAEREKAQREIRHRLRLIADKPSVWHKKEFRFAEWFVEEYEALLKARILGKVLDVPTADIYAKHKTTRADVLAISTHGDLTKRGIGAFDRESHHTTQFLLVEFFGNHPDASRQAFPPPFGDFQFPSPYDKRLPIDPVTGTIDHIEGAEKLQIKPLNPNSGRGEGMPTILLASHTHQRGNLHVLAESRWIDDATFSKEMHGTATQGLAIENTFNRAIAEPDLRPRDKSKEHRDKLRKKIKAAPLTAANTYYNAALTTYTWMRDRMIPALRKGLLSEEKAYYRGIAAREHSHDETTLKSDWDLTDKALDAVFEAAKQNNDEVMGKYKWVPR